MASEHSFANPRAVLRLDYQDSFEVVRSARNDCYQALFKPFFHRCDGTKALGI
jgi:hypothetical protein